MTDNALTVKPEMKREITPLGLIQEALSAKVAPEVLKELVALQQSMVRFQWEEQERQAKIDFDRALNRCQQQIGRVAPNQRRNDTNSQWADYAGVDQIIRPIYTAQDFSISFSEVPPIAQGKVRIQAILARDGISRDYFREITPSTTGPKGGAMATATDADAIAASRAKRYLLLQIFNIAVGIDADEKKGIPQDQGQMDESAVADWIAAIEGSGDKDELKKHFFDAAKAATEAKDRTAIAAFQKAKNETWRKRGFTA